MTHNARATADVLQHRELCASPYITGSPAVVRADALGSTSSAMYSKPSVPDAGNVLPDPPKPQITT